MHASNGTGIHFTDNGSYGTMPNKWKKKLNHYQQRGPLSHMAET
jgi:hypothetical protein